MILPWPSYLFLFFFLITLGLGLKGFFRLSEEKRKVLASHPMRRRRAQRSDL